MANPLYDLKVGDPVVVFDSLRRRGSYEGKVTKVGRKLITVQYLNVWHTQVFRLDTGRSNDKHGHQWIKTVEQAADGQRRDAVLARVRLARIHDLDTETLEAIAAVLDRAEQKGTATS